MMKVAWELGRTESEIASMSPGEFERWGAFFELVAEAQRGPHR